MKIRAARASTLVLGLALSSCSADTPTSSEIPDLPPAPDASRPQDPGLSFEFACPIDLPIELELKAGSRPLSGIPAVTDPEFLSAAEAAAYLSADDLVLGVEVAGRFLAFPARILNYHEVATYSVDRYRYAATW